MGRRREGKRKKDQREDKKGVEGKEKVERKMKRASREEEEEEEGKIWLLVHSALCRSRQGVPDSVAPACSRRGHLSQMRHHGDQ